MDEDEIETFVKIKEKLEKKCKTLEQEKERLKNVVEEDISSLEEVKKLNLQLKNEFNEMYAQYNSIPNDLDRKEARALRAKIQELQNTYSQLQSDFIAQKEHNQRK